jgi:hypothetical protein
MGVFNTGFDTVKLHRPAMSLPPNATAKSFQKFLERAGILGLRFFPGPKYLPWA